MAKIKSSEKKTIELELGPAAAIDHGRWFALFPPTRILADIRGDDTTTGKAHMTQRRPVSCGEAGRG